MPITLGLIVLGMIVYFVLLRVRRGSRMVAEVIDMPTDVRTAARRLGYKRRTDVHPVDGIDDPKLAQVVQHGMARDIEQARNMMVLGHWLVRTCGGAKDAVSRLARRLYVLDEGASAACVISMLQGLSKDDVPTSGQNAAQAEIRQALHAA